MFVTSVPLSVNAMWMFYNIACDVGGDRVSPGPDPQVQQSGPAAMPAPQVQEVPRQTRLLAL